MTLKQTTEGNFASLLMCMDPSADLLGRLRSVPCVKDRISVADQQTTDNKKNNTLLRAFCEVPDDIQESVMNDVISALRSSGQKHVGNIFRKDSDEIPMTDEHQRTLKMKKDQLCHIIDTENGLLNKLVSTEVISPVDEDDIRAMPGYNEKARKLIQVLTRKSDDAFDGLISALNLTGQSHATYVLTGNGSSQPLIEEYRKRLVSNPRDDLVKTMESKNDGLITALMDKGVFSDYDEQRVTGVQPDTTDNRNEIILNLVARKSQSDFFNFISALKDTDQMHVAVKLIGADVVAKIKTVYEGGGRMPDVDAELLEYKREMFQTNGDAVRRVNELLSHNGVSVSAVREGCIEITFTCENVESLNNFRDQFKSGKLATMFNEAFRTRFANKGLKSLKLSIGREQFQTFDRGVPMTIEHCQALLSFEESLVSEIKVSNTFLKSAFGVALC